MLQRELIKLFNTSVLTNIIFMKQVCIAVFVLQPEIVPVVVKVEDLEDAEPDLWSLQIK
jgi:hypothetical protein